MSNSALSPMALRPMFLPHEIFLLIVEVIVNDAEAKAFDQPMTWWLQRFTRDGIEQFGVYHIGDMESRHPGPPGPADRIRTSALRISEVNGHAFRMVRRRFSRLPYWHPWVYHCHSDPTAPRASSYEWVHPGIDFFHPMIEFVRMTGDSAILRLAESVKHALLHQSPRCAQALSHVRNLVFAPMVAEGEDMASSSRALQAIPNLAVVHLGMRMAVESLPRRFCRPGAVIPVQAPELPQVRRYLARFEVFWVPLMERGVRIVLDGSTFDCRKTRYLLELFREEDGLYLRHVDPQSHWFKLRSALEIPIRIP